MRCAWAVMFVAGCTTASAVPVDFTGTYTVTGTFAQHDVDCASVPTTTVDGMCTLIMVNAVPAAEFDHITGCTFFDLNTSNISLGSDGIWLSEVSSTTCVQDCGSGGALPPGAVLETVDDLIHVKPDGRQLVVDRQVRASPGTIAEGSTCAEVDVVTAQHD
jgi:hypothetical protein